MSKLVRHLESNVFRNLFYFILFNNDFIPIVFDLLMI